MSSGIATKTYGVTLVNDQHVEISKSSKNSIQRHEFKLLSEFVFELFKHKNSGEAMKNISNLIVLSLNSFMNNRQNRLISKIDKNLFLTNISEYRNENKQELNDPFEKYSRILNYIHSLVAHCPDLTNKEKLEYCNIERYFMKSFLKELALRF